MFLFTYCHTRACSSELFQTTNYLSHTLRDLQGRRRDTQRERWHSERHTLLGLLWPRSRVVSVLTCLISDTRLIEVHVINLFCLGRRSGRQLPVKTCNRRLGIALPWMLNSSSSECQTVLKTEIKNTLLFLPNLFMRIGEVFRS